MTSRNLIRIATRQSPLALWQATYVKQRLQQFYSGLQVELVGFTTRGDKFLDAPLAKIGGKGLFVKELEQALLNDKADIAVHSMKDVPMELPAGLTLIAICERDDPRDVLVANHFASLDTLPKGARVGTSSLRRQIQLQALRPDLKIIQLRGNINTRLAKLDAGIYDAILLASVGLKRLGLTARICQYLSPELCLPAGGQGALGIESRSEDNWLNGLLQVLHDEASARWVRAERALNHHLNGGCQVPIGCYAIDAPNNPGNLWLRGLVGEPGGEYLLRGQACGQETKPEALGVQVGESLLRQGAKAILQRVYGP